MNIDNINKVIEIIRNEDNYFNMNAFTNSEAKKEQFPCRTPSCICGWANYLNNTSFESTSAARNFLDITEHQANDLFFADDENSFVDDWEKITRAEAIKTLEVLRDSGKVDWSHCNNYEQTRM